MGPGERQDVRVVCAAVLLLVLLQDSASRCGMSLHGRPKALGNPSRARGDRLVVPLRREPAAPRVPPVALVAAVGAARGGSGPRAWNWGLVLGFPTRSQGQGRRRGNPPEVGGQPHLWPHSLLGTRKAPLDTSLHLCAWTSPARCSELLCKALSPSAQTSRAAVTQP